MITFFAKLVTDFRHVALRILIHKAVNDIFQHHKKSLEFKSLVINMVSAWMYFLQYKLDSYSIENLQMHLCAVAM